VDIEGKTKLPEGFTLAWKPETESVDGEAASFEGSISQDKATLILKEKMLFNKRIYQPEDWPDYKKTVEMQKKIINNPVILKVKK
jgi:hypothetical protein